MKKLSLLSGIVVLSCFSYLGAVREVGSAQQFDAVLKENKMVVVDFYMNGCPPCNRLSPVLSELDREFTNVVFIKVNATSVNV